MNTTERRRKGRLSLADYYSLPDPEERLSIVRGMVVREPRAAYPHAVLHTAIASRIGGHVSAHALGQVLTECGFVLREDPPTVLGPDIAFVARGRAPADPARVVHPHFAPDLVIEIISPNERAADVHERLLEFLDAGTRLMWLVYPRRRSVVVYGADRTAHVLNGDEVVDGGDVLPGFRVTVAQLLES
jgi:Uma2 family endonuclease